MTTLDEKGSELLFIQRPLKTYHEDHALAELDPVLQSILINRGIQKGEDCDADLSRLLPFDSLKDIDRACALLHKALLKQERILIVGDFDADGATSTAVAIKGLRALGYAHVDYLVPDRFRFGYGLSSAIVDVALERQPDLIVTVDNGISSIEGVRRARELGIKVLVTDHHLPGELLPEADAIVNPNQADCHFPGKNLAGVAVMFYVLIALRAYLRDKGFYTERSEPNLAHLLDLVAFGTVVDLVPLDTNNRRLVQQGLARIRAGHACMGIKALIEVAGKHEQVFRSSDFAFALGPRLNAAGRLDSMSLGIECLLSDDLLQARKLAGTLDELNEARKSIETGMKTEALSLLPTNLDMAMDMPVICLFDERWHQGVVGIVASRLKEIYHLPAVIFARDDEQPGFLKGSARSVSGLHIRDVLARVDSRHPGLLKKFGGHAMAAGMSIARGDFQRFQACLTEEVLNILGDERDDILQARVYLDPPLSTHHFTLDFAKTLHAYEPWGQHFPEPLFLGRFVIQQQRVLSGKHLKMQVLPEQMATAIEAIAFNVPKALWDFEGCELDLLYRLDINHFRGMESLQLRVDKIIAPQV